MSMLKQVKKDYKDGMTQQSFSNECDINEILERSKKTGLQLSGTQKQPIFADLSNIPDYRESLNIVIEAQASFMTLDPKIREKFDNDPAKLLDYVSKVKTKDDYKEAVKLGLIDEKVVETRFPENSVVPAGATQQA
ncbi:MAG: internal scaffolding protein [Arizlama microvirus]|nr:MAG: internal scaffolding protein [Arizlama microvirus]